MGHFIIKPERDVDFYVEWSSVVDSVVAFGTRAEFLEEPGVTPDRMDRADAHGTSAIRGGGGEGWWDEEFFWVREPLPEPRRLERSKLRPFAEALGKNDIETAFALTAAIEE